MKRIIVLLNFLLYSVLSYSQSAWTEYSSGNNVTGIVKKGNELFLSTYGGGVVKVNTTTLKKRFILA